MKKRFIIFAFSLVVVAKKKRQEEYGNNWQLAPITLFYGKYDITKQFIFIYVFFCVCSDSSCFFCFVFCFLSFFVCSGSSCFFGYVYCLFVCVQSTLAGSTFRIEGSAFVRKLSKLKPRHFMLELVSAQSVTYTGVPRYVRALCLVVIGSHSTVS